jgi:hypothetical protein
MKFLDYDATALALFFIGLYIFIVAGATGLIGTGIYVIGALIGIQFILIALWIGIVFEGK